MSVATLPQSAGATAQVAAFASAADRRRDPATRDALRRLVVDTVGVTVAGLATEPVTLLHGWLTDEDRGTGDPSGAAVWGTPRMIGPADAALLNGTAAHVLDWDDAAPSMAMHPAAVLLPTLFALAARRRITGAQLDDAYCTGSAVFRAVSEILPHATHYGRGWHNTSTTGRLAATAAGADLLGLTPLQTQHALGIAASHAAGSLANFGTMTKPLHAGTAARDAVMAVGLAARGFTANPDQLESRGGFLDLFGDHDPERASTLRDRLDHWSTAWTGDYAIKAYPSCFATQRAIDAGISLREEIGSAGIERIEVTLEAGGTRPLRDELPTTGLEAKFSLEYTLARALVSGDVLLADFADDALAHPGVAELMPRITLTERPASSEPGHTVVRLHTVDGRLLTRTVHHSRGDSHNPLSSGELFSKFRQCVGGDAAEATRWFDALHALPDSDAPCDVQPLLAGPGGTAPTR
ncbi:MmgE/PrpD family protein [Aeromicrobium wangtongii]|uniref:MmgE/PrpD family protein n=1 Tax=Aeromicrobium wangtongii TaxID=2969247 RepID=A0ABY5M8J3_9ACTN|nr:MmgE/PrpD family protein [Aeromicrobium wangtongii]MCD9199836.1 MmgE/PrpD family protein [Aeromicrobium wangtongii]UUP13456.1 MmgE/PrpD family protein [Aeromicrobium wangtongii]